MSKSGKRLAKIALFLLEEAVLEVLEEAKESGDTKGMTPSQIADWLDIMTEIRDRKGTRAARSDCVWSILVTLDQKGLVDHIKNPEISRSIARWRLKG